MFQRRDHMNVKLLAGEQIVLTLTPDIAPRIPRAKALPLTIEMMRKRQFGISFPCDVAQILPVDLIRIERLDRKCSWGEMLDMCSSLVPNRAPLFTLQFPNVFVYVYAVNLSTTPRSTYNPRSNADRRSSTSMA